MSKFKIVGSTLKNSSDPALAKPHAKGTIVEVIQQAKDNRWGRYVFIHYRRCYSYFLESQKNLDEVLSLLKQAREIKPDPNTNIRHVEDQLRNPLELASVKFLIFLKLGLEYLTIEYLFIVNNIHVLKGNKLVSNFTWEELDLVARLKILLKHLNLKSDIPTELTDLIKRRDIVEHPSIDRLCNANPQGWKTVNLAWVLSGDLEKLSDKTIVFINTIIEAFEKFEQKNQMPGTITVKRGIKADELPKKPR